jgi:hypothetical protein
MGTHIVPILPSGGDPADYEMSPLVYTSIVIKQMFVLQVALVMVLETAHQF